MEKRVIYGLPLNPMSLLDQLEGCSFCVSFATRDKLGRQLDQAIELVGENEMLIIDNGAFSLHKQGISTRDEDYLADFEEWAQAILDRCPQAVAVVPDVIDGTEQENTELLALWQLDPARSMPIWHLHESFDYLRYLLDGGWEHLGFGSSGQYWKPGTPEWHARVKEAFDVIDAWEREENAGHVRPRIHMMRAQSLAHLYDFDSSDSTNVAVNHNRFRKLHGNDNHVACFAARVAEKIEATAGRTARHQKLRPLLGHLETYDFTKEIEVEIAARRLNELFARAA